MCRRSEMHLLSDSFNSPTCSLLHFDLISYFVKFFVYCIGFSLLCASVWVCVNFSIVFSVTLYDKLNELGEKKQSLIDEMEKENRGTPAEERERLLKQVNPVSDKYQYFISQFIIWLALWVGKPNWILPCDWLPEHFFMCMCKDLVSVWIHKYSIQKKNWANCTYLDPTLDQNPIHVYNIINS